MLYRRLRLVLRIFLIMLLVLSVLAGSSCNVRGWPEVSPLRPPACNRPSICSGRIRQRCGN